MLIQLLLPPSGSGFLAETRRELAARFTGLTAYLRSPAKGLWTAADGDTELDDVVMVEVVTDTFDRAVAKVCGHPGQAFSPGEHSIAGPDRCDNCRGLSIRSAAVAAGAA